MSPSFCPGFGFTWRISQGGREILDKSAMDLYGKLCVCVQGRGTGGRRLESVTQVLRASCWFTVTSAFNALPLKQSALGGQTLGLLPKHGTVAGVKGTWWTFVE